jgi:hypothetical protein
MGWLVTCAGITAPLKTPRRGGWFDLNVDAAAECHRYANWGFELPVAGALRTPFDNEHAVGVELLDLMIVSV